MSMLQGYLIYSTLRGPASHLLISCLFLKIGSIEGFTVHSEPDRGYLALVNYVQGGSVKANHFGSL